MDVFEYGSHVDLSLVNNLKLTMGAILKSMRMPTQEKNNGRILQLFRFYYTWDHIF